VPNPAAPAEDYADKWATNPNLEHNFWMWHTQVKVDIAKLPAILQGNRLLSDVRNIFQVDLTQDDLQSFESSQTRRAPVVVRAAQVLSFPLPQDHGVKMCDPLGQEFARWRLEELLLKYPGLQLRPATRGPVKLSGCLAFAGEACGRERINDEYQIEIFVPSGFPKLIPSVREMAARIPHSFHKLDDGALCLGSSPFHCVLRAIHTPACQQAREIRDADAEHLLGKDVIDALLKARNLLCQAFIETASDFTEEDARLRARIQEPDRTVRPDVCTIVV
jgi:hypothetical protein